MPQSSSGAIALRKFGRADAQISILGFGGHHLGEAPDQKTAVEIIHRAVDGGITFYDNCWEYRRGKTEIWMGAGLKGRRDKVFLMTKTCPHGRDASIALQMLEESLRRLQTDHLDLWQLHDLRTPGDLRAIFGRGGALEALIQARREGRVRFLGLTGHHDPAILLDAMGRFDFDTVLVALNAADVHDSSFARTVLAEAARRGMGVIGMKVYAAGVLLRAGAHGLTPDRALRYVLSLPGVSTVVIGCSSPEEVDENARIARESRPLDGSAIHAIEQHTAPHAGFFTSYKK